MSSRLQGQFDLTGRVALITGAASILGPQFAASLAEFGAQLALVDINAQACRETASRIEEEYGVKALDLVTDVSEESAVAAMVERVLSSFGTLDVLINAAATKNDSFSPLAEYSLGDWNRVVAVGLTGTFLCTKHVVPYFIERRKGNIINIASIYGIVGPDPRIYEGSLYKGFQLNTPPAYAASKGAVVNYTRYLATTLAPYNIRANRHFSPMGPEKAALFGIKRLTRTTSKPNGGGPYENRV